MNNKTIIYSLLAFLLLSSFFLSYLGNRQADYDYQSKWWTISFSDPRNDALDFTIENHSKFSNFHWTISVGKNMLSEGDVKIRSGESKNIPAKMQNISGKISITVTDGTGEKEIYKVIE